MESKKISQLATELTPSLSDLTIIGDPTTGISKKITLSQMASLFTGTVEEYANLAAFPLVGVADTIYIALDTNILYRWNTGTSAYVELSPNIVSSLVFNDANGFDGTINLVGSVATLTITTALTTGSVGFIGASGALLQDNANFFWDDTNNRLGINTNAPTTALDVFGSGIIGRINGTSTNNAYLGFASAGTNKWSIGNVQSDHRFRIFSEANSAELVSVLQTGEFGIGIANPTTKVHIDGAASALIANLDANVSVAKSLSFRSDNSNRINLEVSGTESGSNAGADLFIRRYSDAGALLSTALTILRSTGSIGIGGTPQIFSTNIYFDVYGATTTQGGIIQTKTSDNSVIGSFYADSLGLNIRTETNHNIIFTLGGAERMKIIQSNGNVGIGGVSANYLLDVNKSVAGDFIARFLNSSSTGYGLYIQTNDNSKPAIRIANASGGNAIDLSGSSTIDFYVLGTSTGQLYADASDFYIGGQTGKGLRLCTNNLGNTRMFITTGGDVLINGTSNTYSNKVKIEGGANLLSLSRTSVREYGFQISSSGEFTIRDYTSAADRFLITSGGTYLMGTAAGSPYNYNVTYNPRTAGLGQGGDFGYITSTRESKGNIETIQNIDFINQLNPVSFNYRKKDIDRKEFINELYEDIYYGFIADEVEALDKNLVFYDDLEDGSKKLSGVHYNSIIAILTKAVQELKAEIDLLKAK